MTRARLKKALEVAGGNYFERFPLRDTLTVDSLGDKVLAIVQVRSCTLDTWLPEQVAFMAETGNHKANAFLEANLREDQKPGYDTAELASFIRKKVELFATLNLFEQGILLSLLICYFVNEQIMRL